jgi:hypothetical protein
VGVFFDFSFIRTRVRACRVWKKTPKTPIHGHILGRCEAPALRIVQKFSLPKMHKPIAGPEGTVAELGKGSPESDLQAMVVLRADGQADLRIPREANQITDAHLGAAKAVPPKLDKGAPAAALAI